MTSVWTVVKRDLGVNRAIVNWPDDMTLHAQNAAIDEVRRIVRERSGHDGKAQIAVRGSMANDTAIPNSDVDIDLVLDVGGRLNDRPNTQNGDARQAHVNDVQERLPLLAQRDEALSLARNLSPEEVDLWCLAANPFGQWGTAGDDIPCAFKKLSQALAAQWFVEILDTRKKDPSAINRCIPLLIRTNNMSVEVDLYVKIFIPGHGMAGVDKLLGMYHFAPEPFPVEIAAVPQVAKHVVWLLKTWKLANDGVEKIKSNHIVHAARTVCEVIEDFNYEIIHKAVFLTLERLLRCYTGGVSYTECGGKPNIFIYAIGSPDNRTPRDVLSVDQAMALCERLAREVLLFRRGALQEALTF